MSLNIIGIVGLVICFGLIFLRMPIALAFGVVGFSGLFVVRGLEPAFNAIGTIPYDTMSRYVWTCFPLFVLMGYLALHSGLAEEFYSGVRRWIGHFRGGLASTVIVGNTGFGACTGAPLSAAVTFTALSLPEMRKYNYDDKLTLGSVAAGSILAGLIPPSLGFIIYGAITETSVGQLFIAGIFPGLLLAGLYIGVIYVLCRRNPALGPPGPRATWRERWMASAGMWALIIVFIVIIGGIYMGLFTPTEAGAFGAFTVLVISLARRRLSWQGFMTSIKESGHAIGMLICLLIGTMVLNLFLVVTHLPQGIATFVGGFTQSPVITIWIIVLVFLVLGTVVDTLALLLLMIPIFYPLIVSLGIDSVHFGVITSLVLATGGLTPPFGITVYAIAGTAKDVPLFDIFRGAAPFIIALMLCEILVVHFPQIALFLPGKMMGG